MNRLNLISEVGLRKTLEAIKGVCILLCCALALEGLGQPLLNSQPVRILTPYNNASKLVRYLYDSLSYVEARAQNQFEYIQFDYVSDGNEVRGYLCKPFNTQAKLPVILYNRGGTGNYGKITEQDFPNFYQLAKRGFIVIASNYRYVGASGSRDQLGGDDLQDIINLYYLLPSISQADTSNVFMLGVSRGGLMTYLTITQLNIKAGAVIGGVTNYHMLAEMRPEFIEGWNDLSPEENYEGLRHILPEFEKNRQAYLDQRSPVKWADQIKCPVLILHSRQDGFVSCEHALEMAGALQKEGKSYQLKIYDEKSHSLPYQYFDSYEEIVEWFRKFMR